MSSFYGVDVAECAGLPVDTTEILDVFEFLKPKASATPLIRIGGDRDGSYLVPDDLDGIAACFSPGVNRIKFFEDFLAERYGIASHMLDFSCEVDQFKTPLMPGMQTFVKKWLDVNAAEDSISLEDWMHEHDAPGDLLLQMDIEGAEFRNILATSPEALARFRVIVLEVHNLRRMLDGPTLRGAIAPFFLRLARDFTTVHAHPNNCCGEFTIPDTDITIPNVVELTFIRNDRFTPAPGPVALPHPLDVSRNVPRNAPLFLSEAWCDGQRPLESRVKMLEDTARYRDDGQAASRDDELSSALLLVTRSLQTLSRLVAPTPKRTGELVEVAAGRPYELSSGYGTSSRTGLVEPRGNYFFHTGFGKDQSIRVDLGHRQRLQRIEVTNRRDGYEERARHIFALLDDGPDHGVQQVLPMYPDRQSPDELWHECAIDFPDTMARYVTITSPMNTALHFSDLKVYAAAGVRPAAPTKSSTVRRVLRGVKTRLRRMSGIR